MSDHKFRFGLIKRSNEDPIPEDEPIFILRARDHLAIRTLQLYEELSVLDGCNSYQMSGLTRVLGAFRAWADEHPGLMKEPGVTQGMPENLVRCVHGRVDLPGAPCALCENEEMEK